MNKLALPIVLLALCGGVLITVVAQVAPKADGAAAAPAPAAAASQPVVCWEGRDGATQVTQRDLQPGLPNVRCSPTTGAALWYGNPLDGTQPMGPMANLDPAVVANAHVKPRSEQLKFLAQCGTACHNGTFPKGFPKDNKPVPIPTMVAMMPELAKFQHGRGAIWCLDCHHATKRDKLFDHAGNLVSFDQPQVLCGKCHGDKLRDWRDGIHGKRIGDFTAGGQKRWFTCTECHNPHEVQDGTRNRGFVAIPPETPPQLPRGLKDASHEKLHPISH